ncbi:DMT family transporter [Agromyces neolithicus]|uniref:EamA domain-containing protein n=1 Tax=Agromyces neolithicus TaxID=269420 RepID=A0ABP4YG88_9MICO
MRFVLAVLLAAVCFGTTGTAQALGPDAGALSLGAARLVVGGGALGLVALALHFAARRRDAAGTPVASTRGDGMRHPLAVRSRRLPTWALIAIGAAGVLAYQPAFFAGTAANGVAVGTVVALGSAPVITGALDWALRRRYPGHRWGLATAIATTGVAILAASTASAGPTAVDAVGASAGPLGLLASVGAGSSYAVYTLAAKALLDRGWSATGSMGALFGAAAVASVPVLAMTDASWLATGPGLAMALWVGLAATAFAYVLFGIGLTGLAPATVSTLTLAEPLTAGLLGVLVLGEALSGGAVAGLIVLAGGIVLFAAGARGGPGGRGGPGARGGPGGRHGAASAGLVGSALGSVGHRELRTHPSSDARVTRVLFARLEPVVLTAGAGTRERDRLTDHDRAKELAVRNTGVTTSTHGAGSPGCRRARCALIEETTDRVDHDAKY